MRLLLVLATTVVLAGCTEYGNFSLNQPSEQEIKTRDQVERETYLSTKSKNPSAFLRDISGIFEDYNLVLPNGNRIRVCSAFGCSHKQVYRLSANLLAKAKNELSSDWSATGERAGLARALSVIEKEMGPATDTTEDKQGGAFLGNGNRKQMNATDEALNATSIMLVMMRYGLIRYHDLASPEWKGGALYPIIIDRETGEKFGIDMGYRDHGGEIKVFPWAENAP